MHKSTGDKIRMAGLGVAVTWFHSPAQAIVAQVLRILLFLRSIIDGTELLDIQNT